MNFTTIKAQAVDNRTGEVLHEETVTFEWNTQAQEKKMLVGVKKFRNALSETHDTYDKHRYKYLGISNIEGVVLKFSIATEQSEGTTKSEPSKERQRILRKAANPEKGSES